jgi:pilus assembly protein CpaC
MAERHDQPETVRHDVCEAPRHTQGDSMTTRNARTGSWKRRGLALGWLLTLAPLGAAVALEPAVERATFRTGPVLAQPTPVKPVEPAKPVAPAVETPTRATPTANEGHRPWEPRQVRMQSLDAKQSIGRTPTPTADERREAAQYVDERIIDPKFSLQVVLGLPRLMQLKELPVKVQIADPTVADYNLLSEKELSIMGRRVGTTVLNIWFADLADKNKQKVISYMVHVVPDPTTRERFEMAIEALELEINRAFPDSYVRLLLVGDKIIVRGQAKDAIQANRILTIVRSNAPQTRERVEAVPGLRNINLNVDGFLGPDGLPRAGLDDFLNGGFEDVINELWVPGEQQVQLKVTVAEMNRSAARTIGMNFSILDQDGNTLFAQLTNADGLRANLPMTFDNGLIQIGLEALTQLNYARSLAQPNLVAMNGQSASYLVGGQFPVPVVTGFTAAGLQGVSFIPFGVQLSFTPYILDKDKIRLQLLADVSTTDESSSGSIGGTEVPGLTTRSVQTTVELREGQTLAIAGIIQNNVTGSANRVPHLGDIPFAGLFFRHDRVTQFEQELVILVTPELVHPLEPAEVPALPGSDVFEPGDLEFFVYGRLESRRAYDYRSSVMTDVDRRKAYRRLQQVFIVGPCGHSDGHW